MGANSMMGDSMGEKRSADIIDSQTELLKKREVSQGGNTNKTILAETGFQPYQKQ